VLEYISIHSLTCILDVNLYYLEIEQRQQDARMASRDLELAGNDEQRKPARKLLRGSNVARPNRSMNVHAERRICSPNSSMTTALFSRMTFGN